MTRQRYFFLILILGTLTALGPFSIDMYLPGFKAIAKYLHTDVAGVGYSLSSFFVGLAAGQLLYGPLLDRFGRKRPLYFGLALYIIASAGCALSTSLQMLVIMRLIQAIGSCAAAVASMAMVRDLFPVSENAKVFALLILVVGASPMVAPAIGGYVTGGPGWQWVFIILGAMALAILLAVIFFLPESYKPDPSYSLKPGPILNSFFTVIRQPQFYTYSLTGAFVFSALFAYVAGSPHVFMEIFSVSEKVYGWIFAALSVGFIGSSQLNSLLLQTYKSEQIAKVALSAQAIITVLFLLCSLAGILELYSTIGFIFMMLCCVGLINPNAAALSLAPFEKNAGTASALFGALQLGIGAAITIIVSMFSQPSVAPLAAIMCAVSLIAFGILFTSLKINRSRFVAAGDKPAVVAH